MVCIILAMTSPGPIQLVDVRSLPAADAFELALRAAERSLARPLPDAFPALDFKELLIIKRKSFSTGSGGSPPVDITESMKKLFEKVDDAGTSVDSYKWTLREDFAPVMTETYHLVAKVVRLKNRKPESFFASIISILAQANETAAEYARWKKEDLLTASEVEIESQRRDLLELTA
jgi:hypothetical protein